MRTATAVVSNGPPGLQRCACRSRSAHGASRLAGLSNTEPSEMNSVYCCASVVAILVFILLVRWRFKPPMDSLQEAVHLLSRADLVRLTADDIERGIGRVTGALSW